MSGNDYIILTPPLTTESLNAALLITESANISTREINQVQSHPHRRRVTENTEVFESDTNQNRRQLKLILSRYLRRDRQSNNLATIIDSLGNGESITWNDLMTKIPANNRSSPEQRTSILHELQESGLVEFDLAANKSIKIRKGPLYNLGT
jgi:hypothetical protein